MLKNSLPTLVILTALGLLSACGGGSTAKITVPGGGAGTGTPQTPFLTGIEVTPEAPYLAAGAPQQFVALGIMSDGTTMDLTKSATWSAASSAVSVNSTGLVTASNSYGVTTVKAASAGISGYTYVTVGTYAPPTPNIYVDPINGSDSNPGTSPTAALKTIAAAQVKGRGSAVGLASGTYYLQSQTNAANAGTLQFTSADSGTTYEAYPSGSTPVISGGYVISGWTAAPSNAGVYVASLSAANFPQCNGQNCNFEGLFYQKASATDSERRSRTRTTPNAQCAGPGADNCPSYLYNNNTGNTVTFTNFGYKGTDVASSYHALALSDIEVLDFEKWTMSRLRLASASGGTATLTSSTYLDTSAANNPGQATAGFLPNHRYLIENCDPGLGTVSGTPIPADAGCTFAPGQWYLDKCPTQLTCSSTDPIWNLYYYPQSGENPATDKVIVPQLTQLLVGSGASNITFYGVTFAHDNWYPGNTAAPINNENNSFSCTAGLLCGLGDQQGSPNVTAAVSFTDSTNVVFDQCTFAHTEGWGVEFVTDGNGTSNGNQVINSSLYDIGTGAIRLGRWPNWVGTDSDANVTQNNLVENNLIRGIGRVQPSGIGTGVYIGNSHNNVIAYNNISDVYSGAIGVGVTYGRKSSGYAHDNVIANNLAYDLGQGVTSDMGGIYFASSGATANPASANGVPVSGNLISGNVIHDVLHDYLTKDGYGGNGLYFDQGTTTVVAHNNLVYKTSGYQLFNNLSDRTNDSFAQDNVIENNVFAYAGQYVIQRGGQNPYSFAFVSNIVYFDPTTTAGGAGSPMTVGLQGGSWPCIATAISSTTIPCNQLFFFDYNDYWITDGSAPQFVTTAANTSVQNGGAGLTTYNLTKWQAQGEDTHSINQDPMFTAPSPTNPAPSDFVLDSPSPALTLGFCGASGQANCPSYYNPTAAGLLSETSAQIAVPVSAPAFPTEIPPTY